MRLKKKYEQLLRQYLETPSVTASENEEVVKFLDSYFIGKGWQTTVIESEEFPGMKNFAARLEPAGLCAAGELVITGHSDTIAPVAGDWDNGLPFKLDYRDGVYICNGAVDTKGPTLAAIIAAAETATAENLTRPISFWINHSEENRIDGRPLKGSLEMIQWAENEAITVDAMIVVEPTNLCPFNSHNGYAEVMIETKGKAAHSSVAEKGINAIELMAEAVKKIRELRKRLRNEYDCPMNIGYIRGGRENQINVVAEKCAIVLDFRNPPNLISTEEVFAMIKQAVESTGAETKLRIDPIPPLHCDPDHEIVKILSRISGNTPQHAPYYTDGAAYVNLFDRGQLKDGICVFGCGDYKYAHTANEQITADEFLSGVKCFAKVIRAYCMN